MNLIIHAMLKNRMYYNFRLTRSRAVETESKNLQLKIVKNVTFWIQAFIKYSRKKKLKKKLEDLHVSQVWDMWNFRCEMCWFANQLDNKEVHNVWNYHKIKMCSFADIYLRISTFNKKKWNKMLKNTRREFDWLNANWISHWNWFRLTGGEDLLNFN